MASCEPQLVSRSLVPPLLEHTFVLDKVVYHLMIWSKSPLDPLLVDSKFYIG